MSLLSDFTLRNPRQGTQFRDAWGPLYERLLAADRDPLPVSAQREGYYSGWDADYWVSGALDALKVIDCLTDGRMRLPSGAKILDFGCSSGRVIRHLAHLLPDEGQAWGADVNGDTLGWLRNHITAPIILFGCGHSPALPIEDRFFDAVVAFSVFTHIDRDEERWLLELRRVLKPGGILYATTLGEGVWREIGPGHVLMANLGGHPDFASQVFGGPMPAPRMSFGFDGRNPYSCTVFRTRQYIEERWAPGFSSFRFLEQYHDFQDGCLLRR